MKQNQRLSIWAAASSLLCSASIAVFAAPVRHSQTAEPQGSQAQASAASGAQAAGPSQADAHEYRNYRLDMNNVTKYVAATKAILKLMSDNPTLKKQLESQRDVPTIDEAVKTTEKYPEVTAGIESAGLTTRDYVVISGTLTGAMMAVDMKRQGQLKSYPTTILPENIAFVEKNYQKLKSMMKVLQTDQDEE